jgi:hypothetical protein
MGPFHDGWTKEGVEKVLAQGEPDDLIYIPIIVSLSPPDCEWAEALCVRLSTHSHFNVRGNAILGFGHLARVCRHLNEAIVKPLIQAALHDEHPYVRAHASDAADDIEQFLGWHIREGSLVTPETSTRADE